MERVEKFARMFSSVPDRESVSKEPLALIALVKDCQKELSIDESDVSMLRSVCALRSDYLAGLILSDAEEVPLLCSDILKRCPFRQDAFMSLVSDLRDGYLKSSPGRPVPSHPGMGENAVQSSSAVPLPPRDPGTLRSVCVRSAEDLYRYGNQDGSIGVVVTEVTDYKATASGNLLLILESPVEDTVGLYLMIDGLELDSELFNFPFYDKSTKTLAVMLPSGIRDSILHMRPSLQVASDLSFLVKKAADHYREFGDLISLPSGARFFPEGSYRFPANHAPTQQQRNAVHCVLNSTLSYVWGAPGTGKTQMVLSTAIMAYMSAGRRIAVIAPTNNSVEQVLRGVIKVIRGDPSFSSVLDPDRDILRVGSATESFMAEFPSMCENRCIADMIDKKRKQQTTIRKVLEGKSSGRFRSDLLLLKRYMQGLGKGDAVTDRTIRSKISSLRSSLEAMAETNGDLHACIAGGLANESQIDDAVSRMITCDHPAADIPEYAEMTRDGLLERIGVLEREIAALENCPEGASFATARIVACTPQMYMMRFAPNGHSGEKPALDVDHIFVDEAGYCGLMNSLALFANQVPVTFLGDHKQLPPVCQVDHDELVRFINQGGFMEYAFLWSYSALYCEKFLSCDMASAEQDFINDADPVFARTVCCNLTESHRFGTNLAEILDRYVYRNGISGDDGSRLEILCIDVRCPPRNQRENRPEAEAVREYIKKEKLKSGSFCVLTPYKRQIRLLKDLMPEHAGSDIMTVHRSQGREWDTVILSVQDGEGIERDVPLRFTSSKSDTGMKVINTAVSRAKKRLVIVCDRGFWCRQGGELIAGLVSPENCREYRL